LLDLKDDFEVEFAEIIQEFLFSLNKNFIFECSFFYQYNERVQEIKGREYLLRTHSSITHCVCNARDCESGDGKR
jgi:hypothetical protein